MKPGNENDDEAGTNGRELNPADEMALSDWDNKLAGILTQMERPEFSRHFEHNPRRSSPEQHNELMLEIEKAMMALPLIYREALDLFEYEELDLSEIAVITDSDISGVKW